MPIPSLEALFRAAQMRDLNQRDFEVAESILSSETAETLKQVNSEGNNLLHEAIKNDNLAMVKLLLKVKKMDVNASNEEGDMPLHLAAGKHSLSLVKALLDSGADVNGKNKLSGDTPLFNATRYDLSLEIPQLLLENGAGINATNNEDETPLFAACRKRNLRVAKLFLASGADPEHTNNSGNTLSSLLEHIEGDHSSTINRKGLLVAIKDAIEEKNKAKSAAHSVSAASIIAAHAARTAADMDVSSSTASPSDAKPIAASRAPIAPTPTRKKAEDPVNPSIEEGSIGASTYSKSKKSAGDSIRKNIENRAPASSGSSSSTAHFNSKHKELIPAR